MGIQTDHVIQARRPDIGVKDRKLNHMWLNDPAVPGDGRVENNKQENEEKYHNLTSELRKTWNTSVTVVYFVVGALGAVCNSLEELIKLNILIDKKVIPKVHIAVLLEPMKILSKVLDLPG